MSRQWDDDEKKRAAAVRRATNADEVKTIVSKLAEIRLDQDDPVILNCLAEAIQQLDTTYRKLRSEP